ncbi:sensor histidine kinase [Streptomyces sp. NBC_01481]|uniref:sensor histidine kinase n=1 Tax=Streptomyces sp. NBC_01481 TaxID=2975869 RepID=UPI00225B9547|nr:histidine kinase [Streptomyces sp. NBC_01481]MCX4586068.1 histidine kinase [Streptomyces sp. NBC_01481]
MALVVVLFEIYFLHNDVLELMRQQFTVAAGVVLGLAAVGSLALVARRRYPVLAGLVGIALVAMTPNVPPVVLPIAAYSAVRYWRYRRVGVVIGVLSLAVALPVAVAIGGKLDTYVGLDDVPTMLLNQVVVMLGAVLLGMYARARQRITENLRERAERMEREQHLLAAQVRLEERARIAREMHDVVAHRVSLMVVHAGALEVSPGDAERTERTAKLMGQTGRQALDELRQILGVLRLDEAEEASVVPQPVLDDLPDLVEQSRSAGLRVTLEVRGRRRPLEGMVERTLYRLVQEALTNVHKHAGRAVTRVRLRYLPDTLQVVVENDTASAPPPSHLPSSGHGLAGLRERVTMVGGTFDAGPVPSGGFRVSARIPVERAGS